MELNAVCGVFMLYVSILVDMSGNHFGETVTQ